MINTLLYCLVAIFRRKKLEEKKKNQLKKSVVTTSKCKSAVHNTTHQRTAGVFIIHQIKKISIATVSVTVLLRASAST